LQGVKAMQKQEKEIKSRNEGNKENGRIQIIFFSKRKDYEIEMKKWERLYNDTDWIDKDYLVVRRIDESKFRQ
jgi:hypothetical protein